MAHSTQHHCNAYPKLPLQKSTLVPASTCSRDDKWVNWRRLWDGVASSEKKLVRFPTELLLPGERTYTLSLLTLFWLNLYYFSRVLFMSFFRHHQYSEIVLYCNNIWSSWISNVSVRIILRLVPWCYNNVLEVLNGLNAKSLDLIICLSRNLSLYIFQNKQNQWTQVSPRW